MDDKGTTMICRNVSASGSVDGEANPSTRPMYLIVVSGGPPGAMLKLAAGGTWVGRSHDNLVRFSDPSLSRRHAAFVADTQGEVWLTDLGSTNGSYLNGNRLSCHLPYRIQDGDRIQFGSSVVVKFVRLDPSDEQFQRELFERTVRDPLTGLYNRAFFLEQIVHLAEQSARGLGLAVLMLDIDHFKRINDAHAHDAGDAVLREVAVVLRESTRNEDLVARYGGEEFVAALPAAAPDQAIERAERIRTNLAARRITAPSVSGSQVLRVTASIGLAFAHPGRPQSTPALITAADHCLYQAKNSGRNRVILRVDPSPKLTTDFYTPESCG